MNRWWWVLLGMMLSGAVLAADANAVRKRSEASMLVTGSVEVAADGTVRDYRIDHPEKLPPRVLELARQAVAGWHFAPTLTDGKPASVKASMSLRFVAKRTDGEHYAISLGSAHFGEEYPPGTVISYKSYAAPNYPDDALYARVTGTVYLIARVNRQGRIDAVDAEQVNLEEADNDAGMERWRKRLTDASIKAVRQWTFNLPTVGPHVQDDHWVARLPINFEIRQSEHPQPQDSYGQWHVYIPGPLQVVAWQDDAHGPSNGVDAIPDGSLAVVGNELHLLSPLGGS